MATPLRLRLAVRPDTPSLSPKGPDAEPLASLRGGGDDAGRLALVARAVEGGHPVPVGYLAGHGGVGVGVADGRGDHREGPRCPGRAPPDPVAGKPAAA